MSDLRETVPLSDDSRATVRQRSWAEIRLRQLRNPPTPVFRAVVANVAVAVVALLALLLYDVALARGAGLPGGDLRTLAFGLFVAVVLLAGSLFTYLWVPLPIGASGRRRRSAWSGLLGFFTAVPVAYLALVVGFQLIRPLLG